VAALCLNPHGPALLWYPARYLFDAQATHASINEWKRPDITVPFHVPIFLAALLLTLTAISRSRPRPFLLMVSLIVVALSMQAVRNAPFVAMVLPVVAGPAMAARGAPARPARDSDVRMSPLAAGALVATVAAIVGPLALLIAGTGVALGVPGQHGYPSAGAEFVRAHYPGQHLLNDYNSGGYLIYKLYPDMPVFIDGRTDFYGNRLMEDYMRMQRAQPGWQDLVTAYGVDVILVDEDLPLAKALLGEPAWRERFHGPREIVFTRQ
jgi:hypothetical protein